MRNVILLTVSMIFILSISSFSFVRGVQYSFSGNETISTTSTPPCTDSDGGKNYYEKGEIVVGNSGGIDCCTTGNVNCTTEGAYLSEKFCDSSTGWGGNYELYECPNGCNDGACILSGETTTIITTSTTTSTTTIPTCTNHAQCSQICTNLCPMNVYGCCYGCKLGQCVNGECQCVDAVTYCSHPNYQKGSSCASTTTTETTAQTTVPITITTSAITTTMVCGNNVCEPGETSKMSYGQITSCPQDCGYEINPYDADVDQCTDSAGKKYSTTGSESAPWFIWNGCARYKYYQVTPGEQIRLHIYTDSCSGCVCYFPNFYIYEYENGNWVHSKYFDLSDKKGIDLNEYYTPKSDKIKIYATDCFYLDVFSKSKVLTTTTTSVPGKCWNHAQCSQACDYMGTEKWKYSQKWTGTCPENVYGCMTGDCCLGQCLYKTTGDCICQRTNTVDIYGAVCPTGTTCGDDCRCHAIENITKINVDITSPKDGQIVTGTVNVIVSASGSNKLANITLGIGETFLTNYTGGITFYLKECVESVGCPSTGTCTYYKKCEYEWDTTKYSGKVLLTASIEDEKDNMDTDTAKVIVINYKSCYDHCKSKGYKYGSCKTSCDDEETNIGVNGCIQVCEVCPAGQVCPPCPINTCCCLEKTTCPYECCKDDEDYDDKKCTAVACPTCEPDEVCPPCIQAKCVNHECVWQEQPEFEIKFKAGWNLFSLPVNKNDQNISDDTDCIFLTKLLHYSDGKYYSTNYPLAGKGYWVKVQSDCRMKVSGPSLSISDFPSLKKGWNQIGAPSENVNIYSVVGECDILSGPWTYNAAAKKYQKAKVLKPGDGYFIKIADDCTLGSDIPPPPPEESSATGMAIRVK